MLTETSDAILARLGAIPGINHTGEWAGEIEDLLKQPHKLPAAFVIYGGSGFGNGPVAMGTAIAPAAQSWSVILIAKNLRSRAEGALEAYAYIERIRAAAAAGGLTKFPVADGWLWPEREELISAKGGVLVYGIDFTLETEV